jgi:hypothetical protein
MHNDGNMQASSPTKANQQTLQEPGQHKYMTLENKKPVKVISQARHIHIHKPGNHSNGQQQQNPSQNQTP